MIDKFYCYLNVIGTVRRIKFWKNGVICTVPFRSKDVRKHRKTCWNRCKVISSQAASAAEANARMNERDTSPSVSDYHTFFLPSLSRLVFFSTVRSFRCKNFRSMARLVRDHLVRVVILLSIMRTRNKSTISKVVIAKLLFLSIS